MKDIKNSNCGTCLMFSSKYGSDRDGTCRLYKEFVPRSYSCQRWISATYTAPREHTTGSVADDVIDLVSEGTVADFGE